jgi:hypothetical protein
MIDNPFSDLMNDVVALVKPEGSRFDGIQANIQSSRIMVTDISIPFEEGDSIERERPGDFIDRYTVLDTGYEAEFHGMPARFNLKVRKDTAIPRIPPAATHTYNLNGPHARVNNNSIDASVNTSFASSQQLFAEIRDALTSLEDVKQRAQLNAHIDEMEATQGTPGFLARYQAFVQGAANHVTVIGPFLPALSQLIG